MGGPASLRAVGWSARGGAGPRGAVQGRDGLVQFPSRPGCLASGSGAGPGCGAAMGPPGPGRRAAQAPA